MSKIEELNAEIAAHIAEADKLQTKSRTEALSPEDDAKLEAELAAAEQKEAEKVTEEREMRLSDSRERMSAPKTPAPRFNANQYHVGNGSKEKVFAEAIAEWIVGAANKNIDGSAQAKLRSAGLSFSGHSLYLPINWRNLNFQERRRTQLTKGGSGSGLEWIYDTFSADVTERVTYQSPLVGLVDTEVTKDGNARTYYIVDDTAMVATLLTASSGTESNPTIPDTNVTSANVQMKSFDLTSGYQKVSFQEDRDASSYLDIPATVAKASALAFARYSENNMINGTGNGVTGVQGIDSISTALSESPVSSWDDDVVEDLYFSIPPEYNNDDCIFMSNTATYTNIRKSLKDDISNSQFTQNRAEDSPQWSRLKGRKYIVSRFAPANTLYYFNPSLYKFRVVEGAHLQMFIEKFYPAKAWASCMSIGGVWLGPTTAASKVAHS